MKTYTLSEMMRAFEVGRNFQLTGENNFQELIEELNQANKISSNSMLAVRAFIGKKVNVDIGCYSFGFCYPDVNILVDVTETEYVFKSDEIDSEDQLWRFPIQDDNCSCVMSLA